MKEYIYVVNMRRWGDRESHSYLLGVFSSKHKAQMAGEKEWEDRGCGKYIPDIKEVKINEKNKQKDIPHRIKNADRLNIGKA